MRSRSRSRLARRLAAVAIGVLTVVLPLPGQSQAGASMPERKTIENIAYARPDPPGSKGHLLDLHLPAHGRDSLRPALVVSGGSGWLAENGKDYSAQVAPFFTDAGYVVAGVSVRASWNARFPAQVHDIKAAIRWLRWHATDYRIDPNRIAVMGDSSGGWAATMAGVTGNDPRLEGDVGVIGVSSAVQAVVDLYGPTDFLQMTAHMIDCAAFNEQYGLRDCHDDPDSPESRLVGCPIQHCPEATRAANPIAYVDDETPPMLIAHGQADNTVPHHQSELLFAALREACSDALFYSVPGIGHDKGIVAPDNPRSETSWTHACASGELPAPVGQRPTLRNIELFLREAMGERA